jgi:hypothetical protein
MRQEVIEIVVRGMAGAALQPRAGMTLHGVIEAEREGLTS